MTKAPKVKKNLSLNSELVRATEYFILRNQGKTGGGAKDFSQAAELGLKILFRVNKTNVARLLKELSGGKATR